MQAMRLASIAAATFVASIILGGLVLFGGGSTQVASADTLAERSAECAKLAAQIKDAKEQWDQARAIVETNPKLVSMSGYEQMVNLGSSYFRLKAQQEDLCTIYMTMPPPTPNPPAVRKICFDLGSAFSALRSQEQGVQQSDFGRYMLRNAQGPWGRTYSSWYKWVGEFQNDVRAIAPLIRGLCPPGSNVTGTTSGGGSQGPSGSGNPAGILGGHGPGPSPSAAGQRTTKTQGDFNLSNRFSVEIDGVVVPGVTRVSSPDIEHAVEAFGTKHQTQHPSGHMSITKDWTNTSEWYKWRQAVLTGNAPRKSISIIFHNDAGEEARRMNFYQCWPTKYIGPNLNAKSSGHASETIEIVYERMELK